MPISYPALGDFNENCAAIGKRLDELSGLHARIATREQALANYYSAERRAGATPVEANERMAEFAKRLDALEYERDLSIIKQCMERTI